MRCNDSLVTWLGALCFLVCANANARFYQSPIYKDIRWLGRANTGVALISDGTALFYNPAGLAKDGIYNVSLVNPAVGANRNIYDSALTFMGSSPQTINEYFEPLMGKPLAAEATVFPYIRVPNFAAGYFLANSQVYHFQNPVNPTLEIDYRYDRGVILGGGYSYLDKLFMGASIRYHNRSMILDSFSGATITELSLQSLLDRIKQGIGWGLNLGLQYRHEITKDQNLHLGVAFEDVGYTTFRSQTLGVGEPLTQATRASVGLAYTGTVPGFSYAFLIDANNLMDYDQSYSKKIQFGAELAMPVMTVRGGMYQGYWTAGLSTSLLPFLTLDIATYAEELGVAGGQQSNRYYMIGLQMGIELNKKKQRKQKYTLDHL